MGEAILGHIQNVNITTPSSISIEISTKSSGSFSKTHTIAIFTGYWSLSSNAFPITITLNAGSSFSKNVWIPLNESNICGNVSASFNTDKKKYSMNGNGSGATAFSTTAIFGI